MQFSYETERLILRMLNDADAARLLDFCKRNVFFFSSYETEYPDNYLSEGYQGLLIKGFTQQFLKSVGVRYYLFLKDDPERIIGSVGLTHIQIGEDKRADLFYKIDKQECGKGYATESCRLLIDEAKKSFGLHRIEADIMPFNDKSKAVAERLGFEYEGVAKKSHRVAGSWEDHERYALILD